MMVNTLYNDYHMPDLYIPLYLELLKCSYYYASLHANHDSIQTMEKRTIISRIKREQSIIRTIYILDFKRKSHLFSKNGRLKYI